MCLHLIEAMEALNHVSLYVQVDEQTLPYLSPIIPPERLIIENRSVNSVIDMEFSIRRAIRELQPDLYHKPTGQLPILPIGCHSVWGVADLNYRYLKMGAMKQFYKQISYRLSAMKAQAIIAVSNSTRDQVVDALGARPEKVRTVYHGTTTFRAEPEPLPDLPRRFVITFGHHRHKNVVKVIEALAIARAHGIDEELVVVGSLDNREELEQVAATAQMTPFVHYAGHITAGQLRYAYENALCLVFLSRHEGFGLPVLEAMGAGCPVISSDAFALPEVVGDAAPIFDCDDSSGVAKEIQRLAEDADYRKSWIAKGHLHQQKFTWRQAAMETIDVYESLL